MFSQMFQLMGQMQVKVFVTKSAGPTTHPPNGLYSWLFCTKHKTWATKSMSWTSAHFFAEVRSSRKYVTRNCWVQGLSEDKWFHDYRDLPVLRLWIQVPSMHTAERQLKSKFCLEDSLSSTSGWWGGAHPALNPWEPALYTAHMHMHWPLVRSSVFPEQGMVDSVIWDGRSYHPPNSAPDVPRKERIAPQECNLLLAA